MTHSNEVYAMDFGPHLFGQICTSQVVIKIGRNVFTLHCAVSLKAFPKSQWKIGIIIINEAFILPGAQCSDGVN